MRDTLRTASPETYLLFTALLGVVIAAGLTQVPALAFGNFWLMAGALVAGDVVVYLMVKLGWLKRPRERNRTA